MKAKEGVSIFIGVILFIFSLLSFLVFDNEMVGYLLMFLLIVSIPISIIFLKGKAAIHEVVFKDRKAFVFKNPLTKKESGRNDELEKLAVMTDEPLFEATAVFPFDFFPNRIILEQKQLIIIYKYFFFSSKEYNVLIEDILTPVVEMSLLFATLKLELGPGGFQQNPPPLRYLKKKDAQRIKRIVIGLIICKKEEISLSGMSRKEVIAKVEEIGSFKSE